MIIGLGNKISTLFGVKYALQLPEYRFRNSRAVEFQLCLSKDINSDDNKFNETIAYLDKFQFSKNDVYKLLQLILEVFEGKVDENELIKYCSTNSDFSSGQWNELSMYLLSMGYFKSAFAFRQMSYKSFDALKNIFIYQLNYTRLRASIYFELGYFDKIKKLIRFNSQNDFWCAFLKQNDKIQYSRYNNDFYNLIRNKSIAVIGPLEFAKDYSKEIANYDIVVELNALDSKREGAQKKYHGMPDIIYYNNSRINELSKIQFSDVVDSAKFIVLKNSRHLAELGQKMPTRVMSSTTTLNWQGSFSMMENTVADLLLFQPAEIKIFGVNLYTSFNYDKSYGNEPPDNMKRITINFTGHDIFTQYIFMHNLYNLGLIKGDEEFDAVLKLGIKGYVNRMQNLYPKFLLPSVI